MWHAGDILGDLFGDLSVKMNFCLSVCLVEFQNPDGAFTWIDLIVTICRHVSELENLPCALLYVNLFNKWDL